MFVIRGFPSHKLPSASRPGCGLRMQGALEVEAAGAHFLDCSRKGCVCRGSWGPKKGSTWGHDPGNPARAVFLWDQEVQSDFIRLNQSLKKKNRKQIKPWGLLIHVPERAGQI